MKGVQCYELFRGIALKNHSFLGVPVEFLLAGRSTKANRQTFCLISYIVHFTIIGLGILLLR